MQSFNDLPYLAKIGLIIGSILLVTVAVYLLWLRPIQTKNDADELTLKTKHAELAQLTPYRAKLSELTAQTAALEAQMEAQKRIVPEEKEVPSFVTMVANEAGASGVQVRRYTPKDTAQKEYYVEVPFEVDVDGPFYAVLNFFDRMQKLERIVNVTHLSMAALKGGKSVPVKKTYKWSPNETVGAAVTLTTFYSVNKPAPVAPAGKTPPPPPPVKK
ncbi:MAG: type 4a pilus biogenesis protein PilO [Acidobacteriota bacterium]|nr:type 4a pilus biogenesis protein PilO [Acidobacteriota bacterium]